MDDNHDEQRRIESGRIERALTDDLWVERETPHLFSVSNDEGDERDVDIEMGTCHCEDYTYRGMKFICKHAIRASVYAAFSDGVHTELQARVVGAVREQGCPYGHVSITAGAVCGGPLALGAYPCPECVKATGHDDWAVWQTLMR